MSRSALLAGAAAFFAGITSLAAAPLHVNNVWIERDRWLLPDWESLTESDDDAIVANLDLIATVSRTLAGGGISLYVAPIPFKARFCQHDLPAGAVSPSVQRRYARSIGWMNDRGVRAVDLAAGFRSLGQAPYYRTDQHWTSPAAESAGAAIATAVGGADAGPPASSRAFVAERLGDLTMLLPPERRATIGPERFVLRTPYDADLAGYDVRTGAVGAPDASARVHVAGSSFVRSFRSMFSDH
jgi:alginate O-acetyltransferase complex protein AlgJ